jgi:hypothetical protein
MGFFKSMTGRLVALSIAIAFIGGGASALMHHGVESTFVLCASLFLPIVITIQGLAHALEDDWFHATVSVAVLPLFFFLWAVGVGSIRENYPGLALPFIALGLVALAVAARPSKSKGTSPMTATPRLARR